jgi:hypothetical protein
MSLTQRATRPDWFYRLVAAYTGLHLVWLVFLVFDFITHPLAPDPLSQTVAFRWLLGFGVLPATLIVSLLVLRRAPGNVTGLFLLLLSVLPMGTALRAGSPLQPYMAVLNTGWSGLWLLGLFFPDGKPQPARLGGPIRVLSALSLLSNAAEHFFDPVVKLDPTLTVPNPLFVATLGPLQALAYGLQEGLLLAVAVLILPSLIWRYRVSDLRGRLQLKWLGWALALFILPVLPLWVSALAAGRTDPFGGLGRLPVLLIALYIFIFPTAAVGIAILRHRLYDIDVIIRRTLVYAVLTALLALAYFGNIILLQNIFGALTGQQQSTLVTVLSTLVIAALFVPLRARVQTLIDRRFYRRKYDAARILAAFGTSARDDVDLDDLTERLLGVTEDTLQPASIGVWLKPPSPRAPAAIAGSERGDQP